MQEPQGPARGARPAAADRQGGGGEAGGRPGPGEYTSGSLISSWPPGLGRPVRWPLPSHFHSQCGHLREEGIWLGFHWTIEWLPIGLPGPKLKLSSVHFCRHPEFHGPFPLPGHPAGAAKCVFHPALWKGSQWSFLVICRHSLGQ